jgi:GDP-mannose 6-dehydrogenase
VAVYDRHVALARLVGANRAYIQREIPHISSLMRESLDEVLAHAEVVVVTRKDSEFEGVAERLRDGQILIDLVGLANRGGDHDDYHGICW